MEWIINSICDAHFFIIFKHDVIIARVILFVFTYGLKRPI